MNKDHFILPHALVQVVGLACVPAQDITCGAGPVARVPVAAAILTLRQRDDGHVEIIAARISDARAAEFPLPYLIEQTLAPGALTIISASDRATLAVDAAQRRYFLEPKLAAVVSGSAMVIDPANLLTPGIDEHALYCRLSIPTEIASDNDTDGLWSHQMAHLVEERALAHAVSRLMLWSNAAAFRASEPGLFFEPMLALAAWLHDRVQDTPGIAGWARSRPVMRAVSFASQYREDLFRRQAGEPGGWTNFRDGLFHT